MKGLQRSISRGPKATAAVLKMDIPFTHVVAIDGAAVGFGTVPLAQLPEGNLLIHGLILNLTTMTRVGTEIIATWIGDTGLGTTPMDDATISAGDDDLIVSGTTIIAVAGVAPAQRRITRTTISEVVIDNTAGALEVNLNILVDDASIADDDSLTVVGSLHMTYTVLGDD